MQILAFLFLIAVSALSAEDNHLLARAVYSPGSVRSADIAEDKYFQPFYNQVVSSTPFAPVGGDSYKCPENYKKQGSGANRLGCAAAPTGLEAEYRFKEALRITYSRFYMPASSYHTTFISATTNSGGLSFQDNAFFYKMVESRTKMGAAFLYSVTDSFRIGPSLQAEKEFYSYIVSPVGLAYFRASSFAITNATSQTGVRDRILSGVAPGVSAELNISKSLGVDLRYERFELTGSFSEEKASAALSGVAIGNSSTYSLSGPFYDASNGNLKHSGYDAYAGVRLGSGLPFALHIGIAERKYVRNYSSYNYFSTAYNAAYGLSNSILNSVLYRIMYTSNRYVQLEHFIQIKAEIGVSF